MMDNPLEKIISIYNRAIREYLNVELRPFNLSESNFYYVLLVCEQPGISQKTLIKKIFRQQSIITKAVHYLTKEDWLQMVVDPDDKRRRRLYPTAKALAAYPEIKTIQKKSETYALQGFTPEEATLLAKLVNKGIDTLLPGHEF